MFLKGNPQIGAAKETIGTVSGSQGVDGVESVARAFLDSGTGRIACLARTVISFDDKEGDERQIYGLDLLRV